MKNEHTLLLISKSLVSHPMTDKNRRLEEATTLIMSTIAASLRRMPCKFCTCHPSPASSREPCSRCWRNCNHLAHTSQSGDRSRIGPFPWRLCYPQRLLVADRLPESCQPCLEGRHAGIGKRDCVVGWDRIGYFELTTARL